MKYLVFIAVASVLGFVSTLTQAAEIRAVRILAGDENSFVQKMATALADVLRQADPTLEVELTAKGNAADVADADSEKRLFVLIGERAFGTADTGMSPVVALLPQRAAVADSRRPLVSMIYFEQPLARVLNLASLLLPGRDGRMQTVGIVVSPEAQRFVTAAETLGRERKLGVRVESVRSEADVGRAIARVVEEAKLLIAVPDAMVHNANTVQSVLLVSYHAGVPVLGYSAAYLRAGAAVALYSTPEQLAQQAADVIANYRANKSVAATQWPRRYVVGINATVVHSLGMTLPDAEVLEKKLASMKE